MSLNTSSAFRARVSAAALAFAVVAGGSFAVAMPASAQTVETPPPAPTESSAPAATPDSSAPATTPESSAPAAAPTDTTAPVSVTTPKTTLGIYEAARGGFTVTGTGFAPNTEVTVTIQPSANGLTTTTSVMADASGVALYQAPASALEPYEVGTILFTMSQSAEPAPDRAGSVLVTFVDDSASTPQLEFSQAVYLPSDVVEYLATGFAPGAQLDVEVTGPASALFDATADENGAVSGELNYRTYDEDGTDLGPADWPLGVYTVTITDRATGAKAQDSFEIAESTVAPVTLILSKNEYAPGETVPYVASGFGATTELTISLEGPVGGSYNGTTDDLGVLAGELEYYQYDEVTGEHLGRLDWPAGTYTLTVTDPVTGQTASATFTVVGSRGGSNPGGSGSQGGGRGDTLATTGATDLFGAAGLGLLLASAGVAVVGLRRRRAADDA